MRYEEIRGSDAIARRFHLRRRYREASDRAKEDLLMAEAAAEGLGLHLRTYQISYRIGGHATDEGFDYDLRRAALIAIIEAFKPYERHTSTSTFRVALHVADAAIILRHACVPLAEDLDYLDVVEITSNAERFGHAALA